VPPLAPTPGDATARNTSETLASCDKSTKN